MLHVCSFRFLSVRTPISIPVHITVSFSACILGRLFTILFLTALLVLIFNVPSDAQNINPSHMKFQEKMVFPDVVSATRNERKMELYRVSEPKPAVGTVKTYVEPITMEPPTETLAETVTETVTETVVGTVVGTDMAVLTVDMIGTTTVTDTTPETDTEVTSENTHTSAFTDLTDRPAGDFLMGAGIAPNVYFESWDVKEERFLFQRDGKRFSFQNADFLRWGNPADFSATESCLILSDGSIFAGIPIKTGTEAEIVMERKLITESVIERKTELLHWENTLFGSISFPVTEVAGILFHTRMPREREPFLRELEHFRAASSLEDLLIFRTGERLTGEFISITDDVLYFRTRALSPTSSAETFLPASQELEISLSQLVALFLTPELGGEFSELHGEISPETYFWIGLSDGSLFRLNPAGNRPALSEIPPETIQYLESPQHSQHFLDTSATAITSATAPIPELRWLDEIPPTQNSENHYAPSISSGNHHRWSVSSENYYPRLTVSGNRLRAGGKIYRHGLCLPAGTALLWKLDEAYSTLGLIPALPSDASLSETPFHLRIFSGENLVYEASFSSENTEKTLKLIRIPLNNTQELRLETSPLALPSSILLLDAFLIP